MFTLVVMSLLGCGGGEVLDQPAPPPIWPMTNLVAAPRPRNPEAAKRPDPLLVLPPVDPTTIAPVDPAAPAPVDPAAPLPEGAEAPDTTEAVVP